MRHCLPLLCALLGGACTHPATPQDAGTTVQDAAMNPRTVRLLVTLGSSSTAGSGASSEDTRYVNVLARDLGARLVNLGTGGQTVEAVQQTYLAQALSALDAGVPAPGEVDVVTFLPLTDFSSKTSAQITAGYAPVLTQLGLTQAWVMFGLSVVDAQYQCGSAGPLRGPHGECYPANLVEEYALKDADMRALLANHPGASAVDIPTMEAQHPAWQAPDGHPNDLGHDFIARSFAHAIRARLGQDAGPPPYP